MPINLHPEIEKLLEGHEDLEQVVNDIVYVYCKGGFIRSADVVYRCIIDRVYRKNKEHTATMLDALTQEFKGVAIVGETDSETIWIPDSDLHDALDGNTEIVVVKSPRKTGISSLKAGEMESIRPSKKNYQ
ncbi:MAG: hypothetical protein EBZ49_00540 [Proteobacteria bacterium]|nr:hypothetical protein [Pseudomonadota bacterium]